MPRCQQTTLDPWEECPVQTHRIPFEEASAHFVARGLRASAFVGFADPKCSGGDEGKTGPKCAFPKKQVRKSRKKRKSGHFQEFFAKHGPGAFLSRGGGSWAVFLSERRCPMPTTAEGRARRRQLSAEYKTLPPEELEWLKDKAFAVAQARQHGVMKLMRKETKRKKLIAKQAPRSFYLGAVKCRSYIT